MRKGISTFFLTSLLVVSSFQVHAQQQDTAKISAKNGNTFISKLQKQEQNEVKRTYNGLQDAIDSLQHIYDRLLEDFADQPEFIKWLTKSQELWHDLRTADIRMRFPRMDRPTFWYGSVFPMCYNMELTHLTKQRITFLNQWIEGTREGDVCSGSIPFKKD